ncbi:Cyctchrome c, class III family protein (fragment) [Desulfosarcina cetonica]
MTRTGPSTFIAAAAVLAGILLAVPARAAGPATDPTPAPTRSAWIAPDQAAAKERAQKVVPFVEAVRDECRLCRQQRLRDQGLGVKDQSQSYFLLDSPILRRTEDHYGPVRFMHAKHAVVVKDCALCHHYRPLDEAASETVRCSACHQEPFKKDHPERIGLKAAYHQQCMGCHQKMDQGPIDCAGCHAKNVPDHKEKIQLAANPQPWQVTAECLRCHPSAGEDMLKSAHWLWKGPSPYTLDHRKEVQLGKATLATNNF